MSAKWIGFLPLALAVVLLDQLGKLHVAATIEIGSRAPLLGDFLSWTHQPAAGGAFGFFRDWMPSAQLLGFALLSLVATLVILSFYRGLARGEHGTAAGLGAMLGGIVSNTIDRVRYGSGVDFLHVGPMTADTLPDFNLADVAIVLGVVTLVVELLATEMATRVSERPDG
jgi:signal peptidase II